MTKRILLILLMTVPALLGSTASYALTPQQAMWQIYNMAKEKPPYDKKPVTKNDIDQWIQATLQIAQSFDAKQLSLSLYSLAKVKKRVPELNIPSDFYAIWKENALGEINNFTPQELSNSIYAMGVLGHNPGDAFWTAWKTVACRKLRNFNSQELSNSIYAMGVLGHNPGSNFWIDWETRALNQLPKFNPQDLSNSIYAMGVLGQNLGGVFWADWETQALSQLPKFNPQELSNSIYAMSVLGHNPGGDFWTAWETQALNQLPKFNSQNLSNSVYAMSVLGHNPGGDFWTAWETQALSQLPKFNSQGLSNSIYAMSVLGHNPGGDFWAAWETQALNQLPKFNSQDLSNSIYATLLLEPRKDLTYLQKEIISKFIEVYLKSKYSIPIAGLHQIHLAIQYLKYRCPEIFSEGQEVLQNFQRKILRSLKERKNMQFISDVIVGKYLKSRFPQIREELQESYWHEILASHRGLALPNRKIAIQFDGPFHLIRDINSHEVQRPQDLLKDKLLTSAGWKVIRIPYRSFHITKEGKITNTSEIDKLLKDILCSGPDSKEEAKVASPKEEQGSSSNVTCSPSRQIGVDLKSEVKLVAPVVHALSKDGVPSGEDAKQKDSKPSSTQTSKPKSTLNPNAKPFVPSWQH